MLDTITQQQLAILTHEERQAEFARYHRMMILDNGTPSRRLTIRPLLARLGRQMVHAGEYLQAQSNPNSSRTLQTSVRS